jgi:hypothetical protein
MDATALIAEAFGHYDLVPVGRDSKASLGKWKDKVFSVRELLYHATRGANVAAKVGRTPGGVRVVVVDRDARDMASWEVLRRHGVARRCNMATVTASGNAHYWFSLEREADALHTRIRLLVEGRRVAVDVKATGYVLLPGSTIGGRAYTFREGKGFKRPGDLNPLPASFLELLKRPRPEAPRVAPAATVDRMIERARNYVQAIVARNHSGAHDAAFRCACKIAERVPDFAAAMALYREWNLSNAVDEDGATPFPFSKRELNHKMEDAWKAVRRN